MFFFFHYTFITLGKPKPNLTIETKPSSSGNKALDEERERWEKSRFCEHRFNGKYVGTEKDNTSPVLCDFTHDVNEDINKKHPAVKGKGDVCYVCDFCPCICCKDCKVDYSSSENTPTEKSVFEKSLTEKTPSEKSSSDNTCSDIVSRQSNLDDFADLSTELPDYTGCDD